MAKDMLEKINNAEEGCRKRESDAKLKSDQKKAEAKTQATKMIADAEQKANENAKALFDAARSQGIEHLSKVKNQSEKQCAAVSELAEKNRHSVIKSAVNLITK